MELHTRLAELEERNLRTVREKTKSKMKLVEERMAEITKDWSRETWTNKIREVQNRRHEIWSERAATESMWRQKQEPDEREKLYYIFGWISARERRKERRVEFNCKK